jgi:DNA-binding transcriptional MerR regulator
MISESDNIRRSQTDPLAGINVLLGLEGDDGDRRETYKIGDLAREFGVTLRTLRFYEDRGLLKPVRRGTARLYTRRDRVHLMLIQLIKTLGFSLTEAKQIIDGREEADGGLTQLQEMLKRFEEQHAQLLAQRQEIETSLEAMERALAVVRHALAAPAR